MKRNPRIPCKYCGEIRTESRNLEFCSRQCSNDFRANKKYETYDELIKEKILKNIEVDENGCWNWKKSKSKSGYACITWKGQKKRGNRISYQTFKGMIPEGLLVCHQCDNRLCLNPEHLFLGNQKENMRDAQKKNRSIKGEKVSISKLKEKEVLQIREMAKMREKSHEKIGEMFGVSQSTVSLIAKRLIWKHI